MSPPRVGIAAGSHLGAEAAARIASSGGNAVDACLAAAVMGWVAEPFFASIGGSGFITVRTPEGAVEVIDGNDAMPLRVPDRAGVGVERVYLDYSNGMYTGIGGGSVAVPGILAATRAAWERYGHIEWEALFQPAIEVARKGLGFPRTSAYFLTATWEPIWSRREEGHVLFQVDGRILEEGERLTQPELAESLALIAAEGPQVFYEGALASRLVEAVTADGGLWSMEDLGGYRAEVRAPISFEAFGWRVESNPPPAVGGAALTHMLALLEGVELSDPVRRLRAIIEAERAAVGYRQQFFADPGQVASGLRDALKGRRPNRSASTTHSSVADAEGFVCAITESAGYGSGLIVEGMLLNNTLGEEELNPLGVHGLPPGARCHSNMAPTVASGPGRTVGLGSPGAERITGAVAQTFMAIALDRKGLADAVATPRAHVADRPQGLLLCYEPGLPGEQIHGYVPRPYDELHMFFGAVQAASVADDGTVEAAHDPRRSGRSLLV